MSRLAISWDCGATGITIDLTISSEDDVGTAATGVDELAKRALREVLDPTLAVPLIGPDL